MIYFIPTELVPDSRKKEEEVLMFFERIKKMSKRKQIALLKCQIGSLQIENLNLEKKRFNEHVAFCQQREKARAYRRILFELDGITEAASKATKEIDAWPST